MDSYINHESWGNNSRTLGKNCIDAYLYTWHIRTYIWVQSSCVKQAKLGFLIVWSVKQETLNWILVVGPCGEAVQTLLFGVLGHLCEHRLSFFKGCTVQHGALLFGSYVSVLPKPRGDQITPKPRTKKGMQGWQLVWGGLVEISLWREIKGESKVLDALWVNCIWHPSLPRVLLLWGCTL